MSLKWNHDKNSLAVSKKFINDARKLLRHLKSKHVKNKDGYAKKAYDINKESLSKGKNRNVLLRMLKEDNMFVLFRKLVTKHEDNLKKSKKQSGI